MQSPASDQVLTGGTLCTPEGIRSASWLRISRGRIAEIGEGDPPAGQRIDARDCWVVPGFIDIHCHGGGGFSFIEEDLDAVRAAAAAHARHGTTTMLASLVSRPVAELAAQVSALRELVDDGVFAGIHLEGPFLSAARCGAHDPALLRPPDPASVQALLAAGRGALRMLTLAPELPGATAAIRQLTDAGVLAAIGHTDAAYEQVLPAIEAGATVATHLFNGMRPLHHRTPGPIAALLADERVSIELICDLVHLHSAVARLAASHAAGRTVLVTDAIAAAAGPDGNYRLGELAVTVREGVPTLDTDGSLAGSTLTMDRAFRNFVRGAGFSISEAVTVTATHPATLLGVGEHTGSLRVGLSADIVLLDEELAVKTVLRRGEVVHTAPAVSPLPAG